MNKTSARATMTTPTVRRGRVAIIALWVTQVALAALLSGKIDVKGKIAVAVLSGGNVDPGLFYKLVA